MFLNKKSKNSRILKMLNKCYSELLLDTLACNFIFCYSLSLYYSTIFITCDGDIKKSSGIVQGSGDTGPVVACEKFSRWGSYICNQF